MNCSVVIKNSGFPGKHATLYLTSLKASTKAETFSI